MKSISLFFLLLLLTGKWSAAQCDKNVTWHSVKQEMINQDGKVEETKTDVLIIETTPEKVTITPPGNNNPFVATIKETICQWAEMYKKGKTLFKIAFTAPSGRSGEGTITIEGKEEKLFLYLQLPKFNGRKVRIEINKYDEMK